MEGEEGRRADAGGRISCLHFDCQIATCHGLKAAAAARASVGMCNYILHREVSCQTQLSQSFLYSQDRFCTQQCNNFTAPFSFPFAAWREMGR